MILVKEDDYFIRKGNDIYTILNISFPQSALGDRVTVKTLEGEKIITVPQGTEHDKIITIKGEGVPFIGTNRRGDHHVVVKLAPPKSMSEEEKLLYEKLFELSKGKKPQERIIDKVKNAFSK